MNFENMMALGLAISDASNRAEEARSTAHHNAITQHYKDLATSYEHEADVHREQQKVKAEANRANSAEGLVLRLRARINYLEKLLGKSFPTIAENAPNFAKNFHASEQTLSNFALSHQAFKELTYDLGLGLGYSEDEADDFYLQRVDGIIDGTNPNERVAERLIPYQEATRKALHASVDERRGWRAQHQTQEANEAAPQQPAPSGYGASTSGYQPARPAPIQWRSSVAKPAGQ